MDGMGRKEISAQGSIYKVKDALLPSNPGPLPTDGDGFCVFKRRKDLNERNATNLHSQSRQANAAGATAKHTKPLLDTSVWQVGYAVVFMGNMAVVGDGSITSGMFEYVSDYDFFDQPPIEVPAEEIGRRKVLPEPYSVAFRFYQQMAQY